MKYLVTFRGLFTVVVASDEVDAKNEALADFEDYGVTEQDFDEMEVEEQS